MLSTRQRREPCIKESQSGSLRKAVHDVMLTDLKNMADYEYHKNILQTNLARFAIKRHWLLRPKLSYQMPSYIKQKNGK